MAESDSHLQNLKDNLFKQCFAIKKMLQNKFTTEEGKK